MSRPDPRSDQTLELRRKIAQARQEFQAAKLGQSEAFPREEMRLVENVASMLAQAELKLMMGLQSQATPRHPIRATSTTIDSSSTSNSTSNPISVSITNSPQGHFTTELLKDMSTQAGLQPPYAPHSMLVVPSGPAFLPLFKLWGGQLGTTPPEVPILNGIQLDLSILALQINALGGKVEIRHNPNQWKRLAFQHALSKDRNQDDKQSRDAAKLLQKTYEEILLPFEEFYIKWQQLPTEEKKRQIPVMSTPLKYISISIRHPAEGTGDSLEPAPTDQVSMLLAQNPVEAGSRMAEIYFQHFYPGIILYTKISRLLQMSRSDLSRYQWADERIEWMLQLQRRSEGQDIADVITYMTDLFSASVSQQLQMARSREVATPDVATTQVPATTPAQKAPIRMVADCDMAAMPPPATKHVIFSTELVEDANTFVEETLAKIEDVSEFSLILACRLGLMDVG